MLGWANRKNLFRTQSIGLLAWFVVAIALRYRLPFGVNHTDEAFYSAMPYSFSLGSRPYVDELAMHQNAAILVLPLYRAYLAIAGSADGIILFNRYLYFAYAAFCSLTAYGLAKRLASASIAGWAAALVVTFSYFNLFALSYNTLCAFSFFCCLVWTTRAVLEERPGLRLFGASLFLIAGVFAYPPLAGAALPYLVATLIWVCKFLPKPARRSALVGLSAGALVALLALMALFRVLDRERIAALMQFSASMGYAQGSTLAKLDLFQSAAWKTHHEALLAYGAIFLAVPLAARFVGRGSWLVAGATLASLLVCYRFTLRRPDEISFAAFFWMAIPLLAPICVALNRRWAYGKLVLTLLWAPSVLNMLCSAYASANGFHAASLGSLGALLAGLTSFSALLAARAAAQPEHRLGYAALLGAFVVAALGIQTHSLFASVYDGGSDSVQACDTRVRSGPFRGTRTTRKEAERTMSVDRDLKSVAGENQTLSVFDSFPSGYLSTRLRPRTFSHWLLALNRRYYQSMMRQTFGTRDERPDFILRISMTDDAKRFWWRAMKREYRVVIDRPEFGYSILQKKQ